MQYFNAMYQPVQNTGGFQNNTPAPSSGGSSGGSSGAATNPLQAIFGNSQPAPNTPWSHSYSGQVNPWGFGAGGAYVGTPTGDGRYNSFATGFNQMGQFVGNTDPNPQPKNPLQDFLKSILGGGAAAGGTGTGGGTGGGIAYPVSGWAPNNPVVGSPVNSTIPSSTGPGENSVSRIIYPSVPFPDNAFFKTNSGIIPESGTTPAGITPATTPTPTTTTPGTPNAGATPTNSFDPNILRALTGMGGGFGGYGVYSPLNSMLPGGSPGTPNNFMGPAGAPQPTDYYSY